MGAEKRHCLLHALHSFLHLILFVTTIAVAAGGAQYEDESVTLATAKNSTIPALYTFGDSYIDPGNNNYIRTTTKVNYSPYGIDFINRKATGRSSNGRLVPDLLVSYLGIKELEPPYLKPKLSIEELKTGVSFASAGTGFDPLTAARYNLIVMRKQAILFRKYKTKLEAAIGKKATEDITKNALYFVNCGINDIANNYYRYPIRPRQYTIQQYQRFLIDHFRQFVQILLDQGARKFAVAGVPPLGCFPTMIDLYSKNPKTDRRCIKHVTAGGRGFNKLLQDELKSLQTRYRDVGAKFTYLDQDKAVSALILKPNQYGFADINVACCTNAEDQCDQFSSSVCPNRSKYIFWDFIHLTEEASSFVFESYRPNIDMIAFA